MAKGMTTRQKEVGQLQKELEKLDAKLNSIVHQLRAEMQKGIDTLGANIKKVIELVMMKHDRPSKGLVAEKSSKVIRETMMGTMMTSQNTSTHIDLTEPSRISTKYSKLSCPKFEGLDFKG